MSNRFLVGIFGGIGSGKKLLSEKLTNQLHNHPKIKVLHQDLAGIQNLNYRIFIDRPFDQLFEKYVLSLPLKSLIDKEKMTKSLADFRKFHMENVIPQKILADFYFLGNLENEDKIHHLALEILKKQRIMRDPNENDDVRIYLEANHGRIQKSHPSKLKNSNIEIF